MIARRQAEANQRQLWAEQDDFHETIRSKLEGLCETNQFANFSRCGLEDIYRTCKSCGAVETIQYRCSLKWCPRCQWWLTERRKKILALWASRVTQPKHLVLTQKNFPVLTGKKLRAHTRALARMRRSKSFKSVKGGCVSVEMTNENRGWHLHSHWLLDARWLDMKAVSTTWGKLVGQEFAVCKIMDVRERDYLQEVTKYVVTGSEMARWDANQIHEFVTAVRGRRFFFAFGSLFKQGPAVRAELRGQAAPTGECECGCNQFRWQDELSVRIAALVAGAGRIGEPAPQASARVRLPGHDSQRREAQPALPAIAADTTPAAGRNSSCDALLRGL